MVNTNYTLINALRKIIIPQMLPSSGRTNDDESPSPPPSPPQSPPPSPPQSPPPSVVSPLDFIARIDFETNPYIDPNSGMTLLGTDISQVMTEDEDAPEGENTGDYNEKGGANRYIQYTGFSYTQYGISLWVKFTSFTVSLELYSRNVWICTNRVAIIYKSQFASNDFLL